MQRLRTLRLGLPGKGHGSQVQQGPSILTRGNPAIHLKDHLNQIPAGRSGRVSVGPPRHQGLFSRDRNQRFSKPLSVAVAMSGGIDSAVAALLLAHSGWSVIGLHLILPAPPSTAERRLSQVKAISNALEIELHTIDISDQFRAKVIEAFVASYRKGKTPNPCVLCNRVIKFEALSAFSREHGLRYIATGHYAISDKGPKEEEVSLFRGFDSSRDQSYFLHRLSGEIIDRAVFPLGYLKKTEVKEIGRLVGISHIPQGESREICFIGKEGYRPLIEEYGPLPAGDIVDREGKVLGRHSGIHRYTIGQRHGMGLASPRPLYVTSIVPDKNLVVTGLKDDLFTRDVSGSGWVWTGKELTQKELRCEAQIRYRHRASPGTLKILPMGMVTFRFDEPQWAVTPGQALVCYLGNRVIGGAWIESQSEK
ncbi:MAG: tRNA 2-thiouridine(34) synthase MnmA [Deltaproteobacteria bacterium CG_4_8_14_3_um_filter_51_11]|nr:MAG: tRNA 2-thiouridine(34) synthase MnmA [Deltaproteobacteria bacterium CG_4_8_14_3_um_filter_51_11]